jgi:hypothetical protein
MLGASQSVNVLVFQFSGPDVSLSAQPSLCHFLSKFPPSGRVAVTGFSGAREGFDYLEVIGGAL